jgi:phenylalanyl-tRNA synthetase alpha chain
VRHRFLVSSLTLRRDPVIEDERVPREAASAHEGCRDALEDTSPVAPRRQVEERPERAIDERRRLVQFEVAHVLLAQVELDVSLVRGRASLRQHLSRRVRADHGGPERLRNRYCDTTRADGELDDGAIGLARELGVERDVIRNACGPAVVDSSKRVVSGQFRRCYSRPMDADRLESQAQSAIGAASTTDELEQARIRFLGRKSELKQALRGVRDRETGMVLNALRTRLEDMIERREHELERVELERTLTEERIDVTFPGERPARGALHPITQIRREVEDIFVGLGYRVVDGREVETVHYIFDQLNMPEGHVTRSPLHTFYLNGDIVLRTETSAQQVRVMEVQDPPVYMVSLGRVYRRDTPEPKRYPIFHQVEGLAVDRGITLADLKGTLQLLLRRLFGEEREVRIRTSFFPFTEPSVEADVECFICEGTGCRVCEYEGWIEVGGAGVVDENVLRNVGYDPEEVSGFAFGWGLERIFMLRHGLPDIRMLWQNDIRLLEQFG